MQTLNPQIAFFSYQMESNDENGKTKEPRVWSARVQVVIPIAGRLHLKLIDASAKG
jgi:hypothetical protein